MDPVNPTPGGSISWTLSLRQCCNLEHHLNDLKIISFMDDGASSDCPLKLTALYTAQPHHQPVIACQQPRFTWHNYTTPDTTATGLVNEIAKNLVTSIALHAGFPWCHAYIGGAHWPIGQHTWLRVERLRVRSPVGLADFLRRTSLGPPVIRPKSLLECPK